MNGLQDFSHHSIRNMIWPMKKWYNTYWKILLETEIKMILNHGMLFKYHRLESEHDWHVRSKHTWDKVDEDRTWDSPRDNTTLNLVRMMLDDDNDGDQVWITLFLSFQYDPVWSSLSVLPLMIFNEDDYCSFCWFERILPSINTDGMYER